MLNLHKWLDEQPSGDAVAMESLRKLADDLEPYLEIKVRVEDVEPIQAVIKASQRVWTASIKDELTTGKRRVHLVSDDALEELRIALVSGGFV